MDTGTKTGIDATKTASKRVIQKTAEATGDLIRSKIAAKINSVGKSKEKGEQRKQKKFTSHQKKHSKLLMTLNCFEHIMQCHCIKMEFQKIVNLLDTMIKDLPRFVT